MTILRQLRKGPGTRLLTLLVLLVCSFLSTTPCAAQSGLKRVGPIDPVTHYPQWFEAHNGLKLGLCTDLAQCFFAPPDPLLPVNYPNNWPTESFYFGLDGVMNGTIGRARLVCSLEASYANGFFVVPGDEIVFTRIRIRVSDLPPGRVFECQHPYGTEFLTADGGGTINFTRDIGIASIGDFTAALNGDLNTFVVPNGTSAAAFTNGQFIADGGLTLVQIDGSAVMTTSSAVPEAQNFFRIIEDATQGTSPGLQIAYPAFYHDGDASTNGRPYIQLNDFAIQGRVPSQFGVEVARADYTMRPVNGSADDVAVGSAANIFANSASGQQLVASLPNYGTVPMIENSDTGIYYARIAIDPTMAPPTAVTVQNLTDVPSTSASGTLVDQIQVQSARFTVDDLNSLTLEDLLVTATSSDHVNPVDLTFTPESLGSITLPTALGTATGACGLSQGIIPPRFVTVTSSRGGSIKVQVEIAGNASTPGGATPAIANAGLDQTVLAGTTVQLDGGSSTGPVNMTYLWTNNYGPGLLVSDLTIANPTFVAPVNVPNGAVDIVFTLTVTDPSNLIASQDTVTVHVNDPVTEPLDVLAITDARFRRAKNFWRATGTATVLAGQTVTIYLDDPRADWSVWNSTHSGLLLKPRRIGTAVVSATGAWNMQNGNGSAVTDGTVPLAADGLVWATSNWVGGSTIPTFAFRIQ